MSANRVSSELAQNERLYNVEATNNVHVGGKRVRGFVGIEAVSYTHLCCGHHISTTDLRTLILDTIRTVSTFAISNQAAFMEKVRSASQLRQTCLLYTSRCV